MADQIPLLRKRMRKQRARIGIRLRFKAARKIVTLAEASSAYLDSQRIACYLAIGGELDCSFLIKHAWRQRKQCYLPLLRNDGNEEPMSFVSYRPGMILFKNMYGIFEPPDSPSIAPQALDLVLTPFVLCDRQMNRVGMGGGYYDRVFAFKKNSTGRVKPILMGLGYRFQQIAKISPQTWDVRLDNIILV